MIKLCNISYVYIIFDYSFNDLIVFYSCQSFNMIIDSKKKEIMLKIKQIPPNILIGKNIRTFNYRLYKITKTCGS